MKSSHVFTTLLLALQAGSAHAAVIAFTATGTSATDATLVSAVNSYRNAISNGGGNNGVAGGPFTNGRREINWDAAGLDSSAVPNSMAGNFFNNNSKRGAVFVADGGGSLLVSGRIAAGSPDLRFSTLNSGFSTTFQSFSADRLFGLSGTNSLTTTFFVPNQPTLAATVSSFGAIFTDVDAVGSMIEAFDINNQFLGAVNVPTLDSGLSFAGISFDGGEQIFSIRITAGGGGLDQNASRTLDMVAMDDFFYSEPQAIPEPSVSIICSLAGLALLRRRRC
ncbi:MAG: hypothetical protein EAZ42_03990 [Verrucomicrobia bacterium]|nr:MAG: hypothetical protein EAZ42_03990 [Verrucomicrobiota bacterium]